MRVDPVRLQALDILVQVDRGELLDPLLNQALIELDDPRGGAFLAELVRGTIQWQARYRHVLQTFVTRKLPDDGVLRQLLYLSLHQLLGLNGVPPYAAIHQAGELCRQRVSPGKVGFVNGVLQAVRRKIIPDRKNGQDADGAASLAKEKRLLRLFADLQADPVGWTAAWHSHPQWLVKRWWDRWGREKTEAICAANNRPVELCFHVLEPATAQQAGQEMAAAGCPVIAPLSGRALVASQRLGQKQLRELLERFSYLIVQDAAIQEATGWLLSGRQATPRSPVWSDPELNVLDLCAAPGGKTAFLASAWGRAQRVVALDNRPERVALLRDTLQRTGLQAVKVVQADGLHPPLADQSCSAVLLDGPCSGTGVLRHHPEGRWRLNQKAPRRNGTLLLKLAEKAADLLAPGGLLMYATCSLEIQENEDVLTALLAGRSDLEPVPDDQGRWQRQWFPGARGGDGFFAARLQKKI